MNDWSVSGYDITFLSNAITAETDRIGDQLRHLRASEVTSGDLAHDVGARYVAVVHGTLADSLAAFQSAGEELARGLTSTLARIESADTTAHDAFGRIDEELR